jgi:hypothetical protein
MCGYLLIRGAYYSFDSATVNSGDLKGFDGVLVVISSQPMIPSMPATEVPNPPDPGYERGRQS